MRYYIKYFHKDSGFIETNFFRFSNQSLVVQQEFVHGRLILMMSALGFGSDKMPIDFIDDAIYENDEWIIHTFYN